MIAIDLLTEKGIDYKIQGNDAVISCLNPEHDDSNPSMRVDKVTGVYHCFSCGYKGNLFTHFGAPASSLEIKIHKIKEKIDRKKAETVGLKLPEERVNWDAPFRNISADTLKIWQAFTWNVPKFEGRIVFPIRDITGKTVGLIGRLIQNQMMMDNRPKYYIYPVGVQLPFCPAKPKLIQNRAILVEGIFDALNLWDNGLKNAVCCFGTKQMNWVKLSLLKMQGVTGLDIMFDGDDAGQQAAAEIKGIAEKMGMSVKIVKLRQGQDPGNLTKESIAEIKRILYEQ
jgi:DNA primase